MMNLISKNSTFAFFGTSHIAVYVLEELEAAGFVPALIVTMPAKKQGRGLAEKPTEVAQWAHERNIPVATDWKAFEAGEWEVAIVVDYGKILPRRILDIPAKGFINVHPSLLPRLRGPSPMRTAILNDDRAVGVTIMQVDEKMDEGPILAQKRIAISDWPPRNADMERALLTEGGKLLAQILPHYLADDIEPQLQNHDLATYSTKFTKEDGLIDLSDDPYKNLLKIRALEGWPGTYAFFERAGKSASRRIRVQVLDAYTANGALMIATVKPEGKKEMSYEEFMRSGARPSTD